MASTSSSSGDLRELVSSQGAATVYPSDDAILATLHQRFRADLPYSRIGAQHLVVVNPQKNLANTNDASAHEYEIRECLLAGVVVEALPALLPVPLGIHHPL